MSPNETSPPAPADSTSIPLLRKTTRGRVATRRPAVPTQGRHPSASKRTLRPNQRQRRTNMTRKSYLCIVIAVSSVIPAATSHAQESTKYQQDFDCSPGMFGCDPDFVMGGPCSPNHTRSQCIVTKVGGDGNCFAGRKHPALDTTNIWESNDPHDCRCRVHAGASGPSSGKVSCSVRITENGVPHPPPTPHFQTPPAMVGCCSAIASTGDYGCTNSQLVYQAKLLGLTPGTDGLALCRSGTVKLTIGGRALAPARCNASGSDIFAIFDVDDTRCR